MSLLSAGVNRRMRLGLAGVALATLISGAPLAAQQPVRRELSVTPWGEVLRIAPNGGWRAKARQVAANRQRMLSRGAIGQLNAPMVAGVPVPGSPAAVSGTINVPVILVRFFDHGTGAAIDTSLITFSNVLFGDVPAGGRPYTVRTYYREVSHNLLTISGSVYGWFTLLGTEVTYTGPAGGCPAGLNTTSHNCNGIFSQSAFNSLRAGLTQALQMADATIDWTQYDNDGPDGIPNSGDDDGVIDLVIFAQSEEDGACFETSNNHPWSHESSGLGYSTHSVGANGQHLTINSYTMQSAVGGASACNTTQIMGVGTAAHETGHALDLPDLYDVGGPSEGAGEWAIMGSGNYTQPLSPAHHDAWSKQQLGWVTLTVLSASGTYSVGPVESKDSVFVIRPTGANPRGEYFLLENKQPVLSDTANMLTGQGGGGTAGKLGGLLIWHIDSAKVAQDGFNGTNNRNHVNSGDPNGVALMQADGLNQLRANSGGNRGDRGDPYPGSTNKTTFGFSTNPAALKNSDNSYVGFGIDSIKQVVPNGAMSFRLVFGGVALVQATSSAALVRVDGLAYNVFAQLLTAGTTHTISIDSAQAPDGLTEYTFVAWSDGGARSHTFTAHQAGDVITATVSVKHLLKVTPTGAGTITSPGLGAPALASGLFIAKDSVVTVIAAPPTHGVVDTWAGDTVANGDTLTLKMVHPFNVTVNFLAPVLNAHFLTQQLVGISTALSTTDKRYLDVLGNNNGKFDLGDFLAWVQKTGATPLSGVAATLPPAPRVVTVQRRGKQ